MISCTFVWDPAAAVRSSRARRRFLFDGTKKNLTVVFSPRYLDVSARLIFLHRSSYRNVPRSRDGGRVRAVDTKNLKHVKKSLFSFALYGWRPHRKEAKYKTPPREFQARNVQLKKKNTRPVKSLGRNEKKKQHVADARNLKTALGEIFSLRCYYYYVDRW